MEPMVHTPKWQFSWRWRDIKISG